MPTVPNRSVLCVWDTNSVVAHRARNQKSVNLPRNSKSCWMYFLHMLCTSSHPWCPGIDQLHSCCRYLVSFQKVQASISHRMMHQCYLQWSIQWDKQYTRWIDPFYLDTVPGHKICIVLIHGCLRKPPGCTECCKRRRKEEDENVNMRIFLFRKNNFTRKNISE